MKETMYPADTVGVDGEVYPTVGENIRNSITPNNIANSIKTNSDKQTVTTSLDVLAFRVTLLALLSGKGGSWGGKKLPPITSEEKEQIKVFLGIS